MVSTFVIHVITWIYNHWNGQTQKYWHSDMRSATENRFKIAKQYVLVSEVDIENIVYTHIKPLQKVWLHFKADSRSHLTHNFLTMHTYSEGLQKPRNVVSWVPHVNKNLHKLALIMIMSGPTNAKATISRIIFARDECHTALKLYIN